MDKKTTPEQVYQAFLQSLEQGSEGARVTFRYAQRPKRWEDVPEEDRQMFCDMAWKLNMFIGEFEV